MDPTQTSPSRVKVQYTDPHGVWPKIEQSLKSKLPLRNLNWYSQTRPLRSIDSLFVELVQDGNLVPDLVLSGSQDDSIGSSKSFDKTQAHKERRHQIPGLRSTSYLKVYLLKCDDSETYKTTSRKLVRDWVKSHGPSAQIKGPNSQENHDAFEWIIVHLAPVEGALWPNKASAGVLEKIRSDFNGSSKHAVDRVGQVPCAFDIPGGDAEQAVSPGPDRDRFNRDADRAWDDLLKKFKSLILASFDQRVRQYEEDIKEKGAQRNIPGWNFCTFFVLKEGLARGFESVGLLDDALTGYDELSAELIAALAAEQEKASSGVGANLFRESTQELSHKAERAMRGLATDFADCASLKVLDSDKKPFRELILANNISMFEFRYYVFARQVAVLMRIASVTRRSQSTEGDDRYRLDAGPLAEICNRAIRFVASASHLMRQDLRSSLKLDNASNERSRAARHTVVENIISSWAYCIAKQILGQTEEANLSIALESVRRDRDHTSISQPQSNLKATMKIDTPTRLSSVHQGLQQMSSQMQRERASESSSSVITPTVIQKDPVLCRLAIQRAELGLLCRRSLRNIGERVGWCTGWRSQSVSEASEDMDDIDIDENASDKNERHEYSLEASHVAIFKASLLGESLEETFRSEQSFYVAYEELTWLAYTLYKYSGDEKSMYHMNADIAMLRFHLEDYESAALYFRQLAPFYGEQNWDELELFILDMYLRCLKALGKSEEYVQIGLKLLSKIMSTRYSGHLTSKTTTNSQLLALHKSASNPGVHLLSILAASKNLKTPFTVHLRNYFASFTVEQQIEHSTGLDGFAIRVTLHHTIDQEFEAWIKMKIVTASKGYSRDIWLSSNGPVQIRPGRTQAQVFSNTVVPGRYLVDVISVQAEKLVFQHDFGSKEREERSGGWELLSFGNIAVPSEPIIVWAPKWSLSMSAILDPHMHLDRNRAIMLTLTCGENTVESATLQVKPATAGLRMYTSDADLTTPNRDKDQTLQAGTISLGRMLPRQSIRISIPFQLDTELKEISLKSDINCITSKGEITYGMTHDMSTVLPLGVNVQDIFKTGELFSRFTVSCSTSVPITVLGHKIESTSVFEALTFPQDGGRCTIFNKQSMSLLYKIVRCPGVAGSDLDNKLRLEIDYECLDDQIVSAAQHHFAQSLERSDLVKFEPLLTSHMLQMLHEKMSHLDLEMIGMLGEIEFWSYSDFNWETILYAIPQSERQAAREWLRKWHKLNETIPLSSNIPSEIRRKVNIPVEIPAMHVLHSANLRILSSRSSFSVGEAIPAEVIISHTREWAQSEVRSEEPLTFCYELEASPDTWLISGRRRTTYTAKEREKKRFDVLLLPQRPGKLMLPTLDIILVEEARDLQAKSPNSDGNEYQWNCEVDYLSQAESLLVVPNLKSTTVALDMDEGQSWLIGSINNSTSRDLLLQEQEHDGSYPPGVGGKFDVDGTVRPFPGNTIICHLPTRSPLVAPLRALYEELADCEYKNLFTLLPPSSWHMTVFDGVCDKVREPGYWTTELDVNAPLSECNDLFKQRLSEFDLKLGLPIAITTEGFSQSASGIAVALRPARDEKIRQLRDRFSNALGVRKPDHQGYAFHLSIAYSIRHLTRGQKMAIGAILERRSRDLPKTFELHAPEFCVFDDMFEFRRQTYIRNKDENWEA